MDLAGSSECAAAGGRRTLVVTAHQRVWCCLHGSPRGRRRRPLSLLTHTCLGRTPPDVLRVTVAPCICRVSYREADERPVSCGSAETHARGKGSRRARVPTGGDEMNTLVTTARLGAESY